MPVKKTRQRKLTKKQQEIMMYIKNYTMARGIAPTIREICQAVGLHSSSTVYNYLCRLECNGYIERTEGARGIRILSQEYGLPAFNGIPVPVVKELKEPDTVYDARNIEDYLSVSEKNIRKNNSHVFYTVKENTVTGCGIQTGDCILVKFTDSVENGKIAVTQYEGGFRLRHSEDMDNTASVRIIGEVIGFYRLVGSRPAENAEEIPSSRL